MKSMNTTKLPTAAQLEAFWGIEEQIPCSTKKDGRYLLPDGSDLMICTSWARYVRRIEGQAVTIHGFMERQNPGARLARVAGGHDFALLDGRYIIDTWAKFAGHAEKAVFDLHSTDDAPLIADLYGDRNAWSRSVEIEHDIETETASQRAQALRGVKFKLRKF